ncbi:GNAT family N-acetyltransferase [Pseudomonas peli]|uniref:GNAT family N-acetyltransferase n=1 Tax=Pseudomonas peli TaxID=592361 RepID=UPI0024AD01F9|nr:GNAT family N-acetyltransferase [Pseudomonas peli]
MKITYRTATADDAAECIKLHIRAKDHYSLGGGLENVETTIKIWQGFIKNKAIIGYVVITEGKICGYCFGSKNTGEIVGVSLLPEYENKGFGRALLTLTVEALQAFGFKRLFLSCTANLAARSYGFYRHLGWKSTGKYDDLNDEILEYYPAEL